MAWSVRPVEQRLKSEGDSVLTVELQLLHNQRLRLLDMHNIRPIPYPSDCQEFSAIFKPWESYGAFSERTGLPRPSSASLS
jgi:hypothetical protein